jgi:hypothetical protein
VTVDILTRDGCWYVYEERFSFSELFRAHLADGYKKNAEFFADFKSVENVARRRLKKLLTKRG